MNSKKGKRSPSNDLTNTEKKNNIKTFYTLMTKGGYIVEG